MSDETDAMQEVIAETAPDRERPLMIGHSRLAALTALVALAGAGSVGHAMPQPFEDTSRRRKNPYPNHDAPPNRAERFMQKQLDAAARREKLDAENHWRISETDFAAQAIAKAKAKRERKALKRLSHTPE